MTRYCLAIADANILQGGEITDYFAGVRVALHDLEGNMNPRGGYPDYATAEDAVAAARRAWLGGSEFEHEGHDFIEDASATVDIVDASTGEVVETLSLTTDAPDGGVEEYDRGNPWWRLGWIVRRNENEGEEE